MVFIDSNPIWNKNRTFWVDFLRRNSPRGSLDRDRGQILQYCSRAVRGGRYKSAITITFVNDTQTCGLLWDWCYFEDTASICTFNYMHVNAINRTAGNVYKVAFWLTRMHAYRYHYTRAYIFAPISLSLHQHRKRILHLWWERKRVKYLYFQEEEKKIEIICEPTLWTDLAAMYTYTLQNTDCFEWKLYRLIFFRFQ